MTDVTPPAHAIDPAAVMARLGTSPEGLTGQEALARLGRHGPNRLPEAWRPGPLRRFLRQFHNPLIYVLVAASAVTLATGHVADTAVILAVVLVNALLGFVQEGRAERSMEAIRGMLAPQATVRRDGRRMTLRGEDLVPGDLVILEPGDRVPADLRLIEAHALSIDEAILTGESVPAAKDIRPVPAEAGPGERASMAHSGTFVTTGSGLGVVTATGPATEIGRISGLVGGIEPLATPLVRQMDAFARWLTVLILIVAGLAVALAVLGRGMAFEEGLMIALGLAVAAIPEGLPAVLTITLAIGVRAMAGRNAIVRRLPAIETIGAVSVICTDKTGTLTRNEMAVTVLAVASGDYGLEGEGYAPEGAVLQDGRPIDPATRPDLQRLAEAARACNDSAIRPGPGGWTAEGDPMEAALAAMAGKVLGPAKPGAPARLAAIPFDARHRFMAVAVGRAGGGRTIWVKGAPERILDMCAMPQEARDAWHGAAGRIAAAGQRVLAFAMGEDAGGAGALDGEALSGRLEFLGLAGLIDPPRPEAVAAVAECRAAGISVKMITGDHAGTAAAIGRIVGLERPDSVLTGAGIDALDDAALAEAAAVTDVFARTSPEHKLRLVAALQSRGLVVAMTGDGVNDAPALKRADAGIAMGRKGSAAAREAADLVLADDNFASIAAAVREGRTVHDNLRKVIAWTLPTNAGEALTILGALVIGLPLPVTAVQILWINLVTAVTLGVALAFEPTEPGTMRRPPRRRDAPLLSGVLAWHAAYVAGLFLVAVFGIYDFAVSSGHPPELARTMAVNMVVVLEIFHLFHVRSIHGSSLTLRGFRGTPAVWAAVLSVTALQLAFTYLPAAHSVFGSAPVPLADGLLILGAGVAFFALLEAEKQIRLALGRTRGAGMRPAAT